MDYLVIIFSLVFVQNFVLSQFIGMCPFFGVSKKRSSAIGMGLAVVFVMALTSLATMAFYRLALKPYGMENYLRILVFILLIAALVQFVEMAMRKITPALYKALGIYLPLNTTNCAVLAAAEINVIKFADDPSFMVCMLKSLLLGAFGGVGFMLAMVLMSGVRERLESAPVPAAFKGMPIAFISASCMALSFMAFAGFI